MKTLGKHTNPKPGLSFPGNAFPRETSNLNEDFGKGFFSLKAMPAQAPASNSKGRPSLGLGIGTGSKRSGPKT